MVILAYILAAVYLVICYGLAQIPMFGGLMTTKNPNWITGELLPRLLIWLLAPILLPLFVIYVIRGGPFTIL